MIFFRYFLKSMFISMHSILGWASFYMNYCINAAWHGGNQPVALLRCNEAQVALIAAFRSSAIRLSSEKRTLDHWAKVQLFYSLAQVRCFRPCFCLRSGLVALFLKMSERRDSWCTDSSFSSLLVKLSQVFESALLDSILKLAVIPVACAHFPTQLFPSSQLCF